MVCACEHVVCSECGADYFLGSGRQIRAKLVKERDAAFAALRRAGVEVPLPTRAEAEDARYCDDLRKRADEARLNVEAEILKRGSAQKLAELRAEEIAKLRAERDAAVAESLQLRRLLTRAHVAWRGSGLNLGATLNATMVDVGAALSAREKGGGG